MAQRGWKIKNDGTHGIYSIKKVPLDPNRSDDKALQVSATLDSK